VTFHGDQTSCDVIRETSVPPLGSSTTREPTPAVVAVGRYGDVTTTAPARHLCSAARPVWGRGVREIPDFCCELEPSDVCLSTGTLGQDTQGLPPRRCRGPAARSASQRVGGSPTPLCSHTQAEAPFKDTPVHSLRLEGCALLAGLARSSSIVHELASRCRTTIEADPPLVPPRAAEDRQCIATDTTGRLGGAR
jgi:hypothetical protein